MTIGYAIQDALIYARAIVSIPVFYVLAFIAMPLKLVGVRDKNNPVAIAAIWVISEATGWGAGP